MNVTNWKDKPKNENKPMSYWNRRFQMARLTAENNRKRLEGNDDKMDVAAVRAAVERWKEKRQ